MSKISKNKIQHIWSILCSGLSVDQQRNNLTLFNIIEQIKIPKNQLVETKDNGEKRFAAPIPFNLITLWRRAEADEAQKADVEIRLIDPTGEVRQIGKYELKFDPKIKRFRSISPWAGIKISSSGVYIFKTYIKEEGQKNFREAGMAYLDVEILPDVRISQKENNNG